MEQRFTTHTERLYKAFSDPLHMKMLRGTSVSEADMMSRQMHYSRVMQNYDDHQDITRAFSGYTEIPLRGNQLFNATMASFIRSWAGYVSVERSMDQSIALLWYDDILGVVDRRPIIPNIGKEDLKGIRSGFQAKAAFVVGKKDYAISTNKKLIPGSVELKFVHALEPNKFITIKDDRQGNLLAPAGVLAPNSGGTIQVNYSTGVITFTVGDAFVIATNDSYSVIGSEDVAGDPAFGQLTGTGNNRITTTTKYIQAVAEPDLLVAESNLQAMAAAKKSMGMDPQQFAAEKLTELYTKLINEKFTEEIVANVQGDNFEIDMAAYITKFVDYQSRLDAFQSDLVNVDTMMAKRTYKATRATAYIVGENVGNYFRKLTIGGNWVDNTESTYVNDLLGHYKGIPVLRSVNIDSNTGYAIHKTPGGELAPIMRGIFLPLTDTPTAANYNNPTQVAKGVYYQETNSIFMPELIQKFTING